MSGLIQWGENALKKSLFRLFQNGGGGGIRTHGTLVTYDGFQDRSDKPLWHSSIQFYQIFLILFVQNILSISYFIVKLF